MRRMKVALASAGALVLLTVAGAVAGPGGEPHQGSQFKLNPASLPPEAGDLESSADDRLDPQNTFNEVLSFDTRGKIGVAFRHTDVPIATLDNQLELKYLFVDRSCGGGGPRITLLIDITGDKRFDVVADGHVGNPPTAPGSCPMNRWTFEDLTDELPRWDVRAMPGATQPPGTTPNVYVPWEVVEAAISALPTNTVLFAKLVDDAGTFLPTSQGCAYFDVVSLGARTLTDHSDTAGNGTVRNNCP
jgi:hypothetical protein